MRPVRPPGKECWVRGGRRRPGDSTWGVSVLGPGAARRGEGNHRTQTCAACALTRATPWTAPSDGSRAGLSPVQTTVLTRTPQVRGTEGAGVGCREMAQVHATCEWRSQIQTHVGWLPPEPGIGGLSSINQPLTSLSAPRESRGGECLLVWGQCLSGA